MFLEKQKENFMGSCKCGCRKEIQSVSFVLLEKQVTDDEVGLHVIRTDLLKVGDVFEFFDDVLRKEFSSLSVNGRVRFKVESIEDGVVQAHFKDEIVRFRTVTREEGLSVALENRNLEIAKLENRCKTLELRNDEMDREIFCLKEHVKFLDTQIRKGPPSYGGVTSGPIKTETDEECF